MQRRRKIIYVNFFPYDNAGRILDFLRDNFSIVVHFSYDHLRLKKNRRSKFTVYQNGKIIGQKNLIWLRTHPFLLFASLPFVALAIFIQTLWYVFLFRKKFGKFDYYFTVNAYTAWLGNTIRRFGYVKKTIFWVWDYFPPDFPDWRIRLARNVYWLFDKPARESSDKVIFLNSKLIVIRKEGDGVTENKNCPIIPIGTNPQSHHAYKKKVIIGHLGMLKVGQGLDLLFDNLAILKKKIKRLKIEIIGSGPEEDHFKARAKNNLSIVKFYCFVENDDDVDKLVKRWTVGIATYLPVKWSEHYWTDPSKIKTYLNQGVPIITTNVTPFAQEIIKYKAGVVINYYNQQEFIEAVEYILKNRNEFSKNALKLAKKYDYKKLYPKLFED